MVQNRERVVRSRRSLIAAHRRTVNLIRGARGNSNANKVRSTIGGLRLLQVVTFKQEDPTEDPLFSYITELMAED